MRTHAQDGTGVPKLKPTSAERALERAQTPVRPVFLDSIDEKGGGAQQPPRIIQAGEQSHGV